MTVRHGRGRFATDRTQATRTIPGDDRGRTRVLRLGVVPEPPETDSPGVSEASSFAPPAEPSNAMSPVHCAHRAPCRHPSWRPRRMHGSRRTSRMPFDSAPPYSSIAAELRQGIRTGQYRPGDRLPSARDLQARHGVANMTAQNALNLLKQEGLTYSVQGRGSFVRRPSASAAIPSASPEPLQSELSTLTAEVRALASDIGALRAQIAEFDTLFRAYASGPRARP
ncbi:winged helix-turn-helix domain-containing protein [Streptomyces sp. NPDC047525]|uniref:GntR family transcriptional regulator n=1 Tax=Streptomyces sp. NPDC047525 TaxID=3155264 RepID=UPI0033D918F0